MDGAPYLRKCYQDLSDALSKMFSSFTIGNCGTQGMKDFMNESKLVDLLNGTIHVPTYEDKRQRTSKIWPRESIKLLHVHLKPRYNFAYYVRITAVNPVYTSSMQT